jgi:methanethiol S-methyltransferase
LFTIGQLLAFVSAFTIWAIVHTAAASRPFKLLARRWLGERLFSGLYRLAYNVGSLVSFLPVLYLGAILIPSNLVWSLSHPWRLIFIAVQVVGVAGVVISVAQTGVMGFVGLSQAHDLVRRQPISEPRTKLVTDGFYALVRHPIYLFSLMVLWFSPIMTFQLLIFNLLAAAYFWMGSVYEERKLVAEFGSEYEEYRAHTPRILPLRCPF